jgi:histone H3
MTRTTQKAKGMSNSKKSKEDTKDNAKTIKNKGGEGIKKPHRFRPGTVALREIRKYQRSVDLLIPKAPFTRLVKKKIHDIISDMKLSRGALEMLHHDLENYLVRYFGKAMQQTIHAKRVTLQSKDMRLTKYLLQ